MAVFEPRWLQGGGGGLGRLWSRLIGVVSPQRSQRALMQLASRTADVLGQAGIQRYAPSQLDNAWCTIPPVRSGSTPDAFYLARYPTTVGQYQRFVEDRGYQNERWWQAGGFGEFSEPERWDEQLQYPARPVVGVGWYEAAAYGAWAGCRLPTDAEWEWAARGPEGREYPWGNEPAEPSRLNCWESGIGHLTPVGIYPLGATPAGVHDLAGNVWEWCSDRVFRGGGWFSGAGGCRAAYRSWGGPSSRDDSLGFRLARSVS